MALRAIGAVSGAEPPPSASPLPQPAPPPAPADPGDLAAVPPALPGRAGSREPVSAWYDEQAQVLAIRTRHGEFGMPAGPDGFDLDDLLYIEGVVAGAIAPVGRRPTGRTAIR